MKVYLVEKGLVSHTVANIRLICGPLWRVSGDRSTLAHKELIAREAGCRTGDLEGGPARPQQVLVANPALFEPLAALLRGAWSTA